ncbi:MAG: hypothetical protein LBD29_02160 [Treponema sp.]|nr:hypothetical protein [Treponema sp.]
MARVTAMEKIEANRTSIHESVHATYKVFREDGIKFLQIDTYGSADREAPGQPSQVIQFDEHFAKKLVSILTKEFGN